MTNQSLIGMTWRRLRSVPRPPVQVADPARWMAAAVTASLVSAHAHLGGDWTGQDDAGLATAWIRPPGTSEVTFLVGGRPGPLGMMGAGAGRTTVLFPPGALGDPVTDDEFAALLNVLPYWQRCRGRMDLEPGNHDASPDRPPPGDPVPSGLDDYAMHVGGPFAWLVLATPAKHQDVKTEQLRAASAASRDHAGAHQRMEAERWVRRIRELDAARTRGVWSVKVLGGGADSSGARVAAGLLCAAGDLSNTGFRLVPDAAVDGLDVLLEASDACTEQDRSVSDECWPFLTGSDVLARMTRPPVREHPGIRLVDAYRFDVTPKETRGPEAPIGDVVDESLRQVGVFSVPHETLNRHGFICGATGSGKSQTTRRLLESLANGQPPVPWLVIEPAKAEYVAMAGRLGPGKVLAIRPGDAHSPPAGINPLEPVTGFPLQSHIDLVRALFVAAFDAEEPFPQILSRSLVQCYTAIGWNVATGEPLAPYKPQFYLDEPRERARTPYPTLQDLQATARRVVDEIGYGREIRDNMRGFVDVRIGSLRLGTPGRFFEGGHPLDIAALLESNVVLELEDVTNEQDQAFLIGTVLIRLVEHLRVRQHDDPARSLRHVIVIEEAHRLLKRLSDGPAAAAVELFAALLAEIRAYGEGVVVVEQIPAKILPDVIKNSAFKVMHRLPAQDDRDAVGSTMNLDPQQSQAVVSFRPGLGAVAVDGDDRPILVQSWPGTEESDRGVRRDPPLAGRRSRLCGPACLDRPCTSREIEEAAQLAELPERVIWTESVAASVAINAVAPAPARPLVAETEASPRVLRCADALSAERATRARFAWLTRHVHPDDFADRVLDLITSIRRGGAATHLPHSAARWAAGAYRWIDEEDLLTHEIASGRGGRSVADLTATFTALRARGLDVEPSNTVAATVEKLLGRPELADHHRGVAFGDVRASGVTVAVRTLTGSDDARAGRTALQHCLASHAVVATLTICWEGSTTDEK